MAKPATPGKPADTPGGKPTAPDIAQQPIDKHEPVALAVEPSVTPDVVIEEPLWGEHDVHTGEDTGHHHHIVRSRDTWGRLVVEFGPDIAAKNSVTFSHPLVAGKRLEV